MNTFIKKFIKENIDAINVGDWMTVCKSWMIFCNHEPAVTRTDFDDFAKTLESAGIMFIDESLKDREECIKHRFYNALNYYRAREFSSVKRDVLLSSWLPYDLGLSYNRIGELLDDVVKEQQLYEEDGRYYFNNIF